MPDLLAYAAQIAPQRSTQYADLAGDLAEAELSASPLGRRARGVARRDIAGQNYVAFAAEAMSDADRMLVGSLATVGNLFELFEEVRGVEGPLLRPVPASYPYALSPDLPAIRRYKGKTSELFTLFALNMAKFAGAHAETPWRDMRVLDPLCGGATTLLTALALGAHAAGIERSRADVDSTAAFLTQFCREARISLRIREDKLRAFGAHRWNFQIGRERDDPRRCVLVSGDSALARDLVAGFGRAHVVMADLPYGIQHEAPLAELLGACLPGWAALIEPGGTLALSWDSTRLGRGELAAVVEGAAPLRVVDGPPYDALAHRVDRVIRRRDLLVARLV